METGGGFTCIPGFFCSPHFSSQRWSDDLSVMAIEHHWRTHTSRNSCPFLNVLKWSMMFYAIEFLTFLFCFLCRWVTGHWSPCSATCEKGVQHREVTCVYQLQNGTYVNTRDLYCLGNKPTTVQSCEGRDCLSIWEASEWSKVRLSSRKKPGSAQLWIRWS